MVKIKRKIPSQATSGADTFSDQLVGVQITDGTSQLTNTNFTLDRVIPERDSKDFLSEPFSDFISLSSIVTDKTFTKQKEIKFKGDFNDAGKSLFGSLKLRLDVAIKKIINFYPSSFLIGKGGYVRTSNNTVQNIVYNTSTDTTDFFVEKSIIYNPLEILFDKQKEGTPIINPLRNFYSEFKKYRLIVDNESYDIVNYVKPDTNNQIKLRVNGNPFNYSTGYTENLIIKPNDTYVEEFYSNLDELESLLLNRETNPLHAVSFKVPRDSFDTSRIDLVTIELNWPTDGDNISIDGIDFIDYIEKLLTIAEEIDNYKSNLVTRFLTSPQLFEFDTEDQRMNSIFQLYGQSIDRIKK